MYPSEPDVYFLAALGATEVASRCDFSEDVLRESINLAYTNEARQSEHRLDSLCCQAALLLANSRSTAAWQASS